MEFDSQNRGTLFYVILFLVLIGAIVYFGHNVKKLINSQNQPPVAETSQTVETQK